jgi:hypothetical protein
MREVMKTSMLTKDQQTILDLGSGLLRRHILFSRWVVLLGWVQFLSWAFSLKGAQFNLDS